jgi:transcriptional regulator with XRE-family HTH domain
MLSFSASALKERRAEAGLSRDKLAKASGVAYDTLLKLESGRRKLPRSDTLGLLAGALGCPVDALFRETP